MRPRRLAGGAERVSDVLGTLTGRIQRAHARLGGGQVEQTLQQLGGGFRSQLGIADEQDSGSARVEQLRVMHLDR